MRLHDAEVVDTFAEAFGMWGARIVVTAATPEWAMHAGRSLTGFATSVIGCKCEAGIVLRRRGAGSAATITSLRVFGGRRPRCSRRSGRVPDRRIPIQRQLTRTRSRRLTRSRPCCSVLASTIASRGDSCLQKVTSASNFSSGSTAK